MDFGKVPHAALDAIDFSLPAEPPENARVLSGAAPPVVRLYVGATGYNMKAWVGRWYPAGTPESRFLACYGQQFNAIEHNTTHYRIPEPNLVTHWRNAVPEDFRFCPKIPQLISHARRLSEAQSSMERFCEIIVGLENRLGCCFLQLPPYFGPERLRELEHFLIVFSNRIPLAVEVRHPAFFSQKEAQQALFNLLRAHQVTAVITDVAGRRDVCHGHLTTRRTIIRFVGNALHPTDFTRTQAWAERLAYWVHAGLEEAYFFCHEPDNLLAPELAAFAVEAFRKHIPHAGLRGPIPRASLSGGQIDLFE
ncbi:MAG: DUF72 domain-containing protein [Saprospiraceae bacterium]|nr:DUF72 domain-containing protein [Saprospiraceae bacterium]MDW8483712.1 DUF72 domain-containing protein [Saprospiraceae bacterium]